MDKFFKKIGNFFKKIGLFIWKYLKICWAYIRDNAWIQPIAIVVLIFGIVFGFEGIVTLIDNAKNSETGTASKKNKYTTLTMEEAQEMIEDGQDFTLFIGSRDCSYCISFAKVINKYIESSGNKVYYVDLGNSLSFEKSIYTNWAERLGNIDTRAEVSKDDGGFNGTSISTPTVVVVRGGEFADAKSGAHGLSGGMEYLNFVDFVNGKYIGKYES